MNNSSEIQAPHILVVDDDKEIVEGFKVILEEEGFKITGEYNGHSALSSLEKRDFEFAFVDGLLPGMDGFQLVGKIRETSKGAKLPIVMISGVFRASNHAREATEKFHLIDYLEKPVGPVQILQVLKQHFKENYPGKAKINQPVQKVINPNAPVFNDFFLYDQTKLPLQGQLEKIPFPVLMNQIYNRKKTGQLLIHSQKAKKLLSFEKGRLIAIRSNIVNECLGQLLLSTGQITDESFKQTFDIMKKTGQRQGDLLLQTGAITSLQLSEALKEQFENKLYNIFSWQTGQFQFKETNQLPPQHLDILIHPYSMIKEGIKRSVSQTALNQFLMPYTSSLVEASENCQTIMQKCGFNLKETRFASETKGNEPLEEILINPIKTRDLMKIFAFTLIAIGAWQVSQPERQINRSIHELDNVKDGAQSTLKAHADHLLKGSQNNKQPSIKAVAETSTQIKQIDAETQESMAMETAMQKMNDEEKEYYKQLYEFHESLKDKTYFEIFETDLKEKMDKADVKKKFLVLAKKYHPDTIPHQQIPEIKKVADELFTLLSKARDTITNDKKRVEYVDYLNGGGNEDATEEVAKILASEQHFYNGQTAARRKDWVNAAKHFKDAIELNPNEGEFYAELGWARFNMSDNDMVARQEAMADINKAIELSPKFANAYYYLGAIYKASDNLPMAAENFIQTVKIDKKHTKAKSEIHLLKMRKANKDKEKNNKKGIFSFLNKSK